MRLLSLIVSAGLLTPAFASAQTIGLMIGAEDYAVLPDLNRGQRIAAAVSSLEESGMEVTYLGEPLQDEITSALAAFGRRSGQADAVLVALSGRFVHSVTETYYLPTEATAGPLATLHTNALPLSTVTALLAAKPGKAILVLSTDEREVEFGRGLSLGIGPLDIPQGVTVIEGDPRRTADVLEDVLSRPGRPFVGATRQREVTVSGFAPNTLIFLDGSTPRPQTALDRIGDIRDWRAANRANTVEAYKRYMASHPNGEFVTMAENRVRALTDTPEARAERAEQSLDLNRTSRRDIQRDLSLLGFDTRGIDGIFGRGTRAAISAWQRAERFEETGFINSEQIALLDEQARRRAEELEAEAEARRQQQLASDLEFWNQTGSRGNEAGLRAYLERFPDGEFAELAIERLQVIEERKRSRADRIDRQLWDRATAENTAASYSRYLIEAPNGAFREEAEARLAGLRREEQFAGAARAEQAMGMSSGTRRVIEARLEGLGLKPGRVDGEFDEDTRRAIRRYQSARNLPESGYVSNDMMVQLMADTVRQIFR